jgi:hypothetical protein
MSRLPYLQTAVFDVPVPADVSNPELQSALEKGFNDFRARTGAVLLHATMQHESTLTGEEAQDGRSFITVRHESPDGNPDAFTSAAYAVASTLGLRLACVQQITSALAGAWSRDDLRSHLPFEPEASNNEVLTEGPEWFR